MNGLACGGEAVREGPAYQRVAEELREGIRSGTYPPGSRLPTIAELCRAHGVSEIVIRQAIALLRTEGLVDTRRGGGTVVRTRPPVRRRAVERYRAGTPAEAGPATSFTADHSLDWPDYRLTARYSRVAADEELAGMFAVQPGTELLRRQFLFYAREAPEQISINFLPWRLVGGTPVADPAREPWPGGTPAQLAYLGHPATRVEESVTARMPTQAEIHQLLVAQGTPVFSILRRMFSGDQVLEVCRHIVIPADRVVLDYRIDL
jgi:GntR family transcriptional regulator